VPVAREETGLRAQVNYEVFAYGVSDED